MAHLDNHCAFLRGGPSAGTCNSLFLDGFFGKFSCMFVNNHVFHGVFFSLVNFCCDDFVASSSCRDLTQFATSFFWCCQFAAGWPIRRRFPCRRNGPNGIFWPSGWEFEVFFLHKLQADPCHEPAF